MELDDLRTSISLRKSKVTVERISVYIVIKKLLEHGNDVYHAPVQMTT